MTIFDLIKVAVFGLFLTGFAYGVLNLLAATLGNNPCTSGKVNKGALGLAAVLALVFLVTCYDDYKGWLSQPSNGHNPRYAEYYRK